MPATAVGDADFVTATSASGMTVVVAEELLLPESESAVVDDTVAVFVTSPGAAGPFTTSVNMLGVPGAIREFVQLTVPAAPEAGVVHDLSLIHI